MADEPQEYTTAAIVQAAADERPLDIKTGFGMLMVDKIAAAIAGKRDEMSSTMFNPVSGDGDNA